MVSRLSMDASYFLQGLCIFIASRVTNFCTRGGSDIMPGFVTPLSGFA
jgi:hypothetical protein